MHKDELIQMHTLLCQIKNYIETATIAKDASFSGYDAMKISPIHVHRSKTDHKRAIFTLGKEIAEVLSNGEENGAQRMSMRLDDMLHRMERVRAH